MGGPEAKLYVIPGSHPATAVRRMLELKGIPYKRVDLMPVISRAALRAMRFPSTTIPSLAIAGRKITGSREIARELDGIQPEPPLFPNDSEQRIKVEDAERWGEEALADPVRRIFWKSTRRDRSGMASYAEGAKLGVPIGLAVRTAAPFIAAEIRIHGAHDDAVRVDLAALTSSLDKIDGWIADGVLGGDPPNAADLQIAGALRLAMSLDDLRPFIDERPAGRMARRAIPEFAGRTPPALPAEWLEPLRAAAPIRAT
jgi:glutathione S-transferase